MNEAVMTDTRQLLSDCAEPHNLFFIPLSPIYTLWSCTHNGIFLASEP